MKSQAFFRGFRSAAAVPAAFATFVLRPAVAVLLLAAAGCADVEVWPGPSRPFEGRPHAVPGLVEIPKYDFFMAIQDRAFNDDGSLFYPNTRELFDEIVNPYIPDGPFSPIWNPEFFGNTMVVNGVTWPVLQVERRRYRFRFLNGCNSRFLILKFTEADPATLDAGAAPAGRDGPPVGTPGAPPGRHADLPDAVRRTGEEPTVVGPVDGGWTAR